MLLWQCCSTSNTNGGGAVAIELNTGSKTHRRATNNTMQVLCGQLVQLTPITGMELVIAA